MRSALGCLAVLAVGAFPCPGQALQPVTPPVGAGNPPPPRLPARTMAEHPNVVTPAPAALSVATSDRRQSRAFFNAVFSASEGVPIDWTGALSGTPGTSATGTAGTTSDAFKSAVQLRINWVRAMAGVPAAVAMDSVESAQDQDAALMMAANNKLSHTPTSDWLLYTSDGATAAGKSNIDLGNVGPDSIAYGYIQDFGSNNTALGHRRWILYPQTRTMATGDIPATNGFNSANATWILDSNFGAARPAVRDGYVAWPPPGFVPYQVVFPRWSLSYPDADFSGATVTMTSNGASVPVQVEALDNPAYGENTIAWDYNGLDGSTVNSSAPRPGSDLAYQVAVHGVMVNGSPTNYDYTVTVFDPAVAGPGESLPVITGPQGPAVGQGASYSVSGIPSFAGGFTTRVSTFSPFSTVYGAEGGLQGVVATTSGSYNPVDTSTKASGGASYHMAMPDLTTQMLALPGEYAVPAGAPASFNFSSRLGIATSAETAHAQVSVDDGKTWNDVFTEVGLGDPGETSFTSHSIDLSPYAGLVIEVRFTFTYTSGQSAYIDTTSGVGWNLDNIALQGVELATVGAPGPAVTGGTFTFTPSSTARVGLQAEAMLFGEYPVTWGPVYIVDPTASGTPPPGGQTARLVNLSCRAGVGTGANILIVGFVSGGIGTTGTQAVLVRGTGPALSAFGVAGVLPDPALTIFQGSGVVAANTGWGTNAAQITAEDSALGAFALTDTTSRDSALYIPNLAPNAYTAQVVGASSDTGVALAEVYDATSPAAYSATAPRLINLSARVQVGTGGNILIVGFVVGGTGSETVLVRASGPALIPFGVGGTLPDPKLQIVNQASTTIASNTGWGGSSQISGAAASVGAFRWTNSSSNDSAILIALPPGAYTAQVSGASGDTGVALVEVYEVP